MRKIIYLLLISFSLGMSAQNNLQLHYDFGSDRKCLTSTIEHFSLDKYGNTFFFVDFNYKGDAPIEAYWEIAREFKNWNAPFAVHIEYNGGLNKYVGINNAYLLGGTYSLHTSDYAAGISLSAMYKYIQGNSSPHNFQLTGVWFVHLLNNKLSFLGFADFWREKGFVTKKNTPDVLRESSFIFLAEPQLWYNFNKSFSIGTEVELAYCFGGVDGFKVRPTAGVKWRF